MAGADANGLAGRRRFTRRSKLAIIQSLGAEAVVDVASWLRNLGFGQYEAAFRDNAVDGDVLAYLTADDLKDLGVAVVGHRRKLLEAIARLRAASSGASAEPPPMPPAPVAAAATSALAERRPITVMFCDLVGSTELAARLARLYRSTGRPVEARGVLAPALEGFAPTSEMPEIAEAEALLTV